MLGVRVPPGLPSYFFCGDTPETVDMDKIKTIFLTSRLFLKEARTELSKVTWPTTRQAIASTSVVLVVVLVVSLILGIFDFGLVKMMKLILG